MKKVLTIVLLFIGTMTFAQSLSIKFTKADSIFMKEAISASIKSLMETDSSLINLTFKPNRIYNVKCNKDSNGNEELIECLKIIYSANKKKNISISEEDYLDEYINGYMMGQLSFYYNNDFNYKILEIKLNKIKRELRKLK